MKAKYLVGIAALGVLLMAAGSPTVADRQPEELAALEANAGSVEAALADGVIDDAEVSTALDTAVACMTARGVDVTRAEFAAGKLSLTYAATVPGAEDIEAECFAVEFNDLATAYGLANAPSAAELEAFYSEVAGCLRDRGFDVAGPEDVDHVSDRSAAIDCQLEVEARMFG